MTLRPAELYRAAGRNRAGFDMSFELRGILRNLSLRGARAARPTRSYCKRPNSKTTFSTERSSRRATPRSKAIKNGVKHEHRRDNRRQSRIFTCPWATAPISPPPTSSSSKTRVRKPAGDSLEKANSTNRLRQALARRMRRMGSPPSNMDIKMALNVKPNVEMQLTLDQAGDNLLKGRGNGTH